MFNISIENSTKTIKRLYYKSVAVFIFWLIVYLEYTTFKRGYILSIKLLLLIKTKNKCNKIKVLTLT
jgi:hypothetical protein